MSHGAEPRKRTRDPEGKRAAILAAARAVFAENGYEKATIREIARRAGVTHGLVVLHFASKEKLFLAAVPGASILAASEPGDLDEFPARVAKAFVERMESGDSADPFLAVVRSAASDQQLAKELLRAMREETLVVYRAMLTAPDVDARVDMAGAHLLGVTFNRYVLAEGPLAAMPAGELIDRLARTLRTILFD
nr:TetR family transcriptional regulator [uncultured Actinoplanes sp.]